MKRSDSMRKLLLVVLAIVLTSAGVRGQIREDAPKPVLPSSLAWTSPPGMPHLRVAWVLGAEKEAGTYALRVELAGGGRIPPHTHPDTRYSTVLSGTLYVGFGESMDDAKMVAVPEGAVYVAPAGVPHHLWAKDGEVTYQEAGTGPTATIPASP